MRDKISNGYNSFAMIKVLIIVITGFSLFACAGKQKTTDEDGKPIVDMTRPPIMINDIKDQQVESNPDEVISYEVWKQQQAEIKSGDAKSDQKEVEPETPE